MSDATITAIVSGAVTIVTMVVGFLTLWVRLKYRVDGVENKIDANTAITKAGTAAAAQSARVAASTAADAKAVAESIHNKVNGGIDHAISVAMAPMVEKLNEHAASDERTIEEINKRFKDLTEYVHKRNHDVLDALQSQSFKIELVMKKLDVGTSSTPGTPSVPSSP